MYKLVLYFCSLACVVIVDGSSSRPANSLLKEDQDHLIKIQQQRFKARNKDFFHESEVIDIIIPPRRLDEEIEFTTHIITTDANGATAVFAIDVDGDGDIDVLSASFNDDTIAWYENDGNQGFTKHKITTDAGGAFGVFAIDVDGDGDIDVLSASGLDDTIAWYENDGNQGFTKHEITTDAITAYAVFAIDVDGDGDIDVLSASRDDDTIAWYENDGNQGFTKRPITTDADGAEAVFAIDVDGDGDIDVLSASFNDDTIAWYENDGNQGFTKRAITTDADSARAVFAIDVDGDGDIDVLSASAGDDTIAWYENAGNQRFTKRAITTDADVARAVFAIDVDGDGDIDVLSASWNDDTIAWYENDGNQGFTKHEITTDADAARAVFAIDVDGDGDIDVLSASYSDDIIAWYENLMPTEGSASPTLHPTPRPTPKPTPMPTLLPTVHPTPNPTPKPTPSPTFKSSPSPTLCRNDPTWYKSGDSSKDCEWVSAFLPSRCDVRGADGRDASEACFNACGCPSPTIEPTVLPTTRPSFPTTTIPTTLKPTFTPAQEPTPRPSFTPTTIPTTLKPTFTPTQEPTPRPTFPLGGKSSSSSSSDDSTPIIIGVAAGGLLLLLFVCVFGCYYVRRESLSRAKHTKQDDIDDEEAQSLSQTLSLQEANQQEEQPSESAAAARANARVIVNGLLVGASVVPGLGKVSQALLAILNEVDAMSKKAQDIVAAGQRVCDTISFLSILSENAASFQTGNAKALVEQHMTELEALLNRFQDAVASFNKKGWLRRKWHSIAHGDLLTTLDRNIVICLDKLQAAYNLANDRQTKLQLDKLLKAQTYALEVAMFKEIQAVAKIDGTTHESAATCLAKDDATTRAVAQKADVDSHEIFVELNAAIKKVESQLSDMEQKLDSRFEDIEHNLARKTSQDKARELKAGVLNLEVEIDQMESKPFARGGQAQVHRAFLDEQQVAVKLVPLGNIAESEREKLTNELKRELAIMVKLHSPLVVQLYGIVTRNMSYFGIVLEYMDGGSLRARLDDVIEHPVIEAIQMRTWSRQIANGMRYLYSRGVEHRDLKTSNVLLGHNDSCKISDFGLARCEELKSRLSSTTRRHGAVGTLPFMAPEVLRLKPFSEKADVYSYAMTLIEIVTRKVPWKGLTNEQIITQVLVEQARPDLHADTPSDLKSIIEACWVHEAAARPSFLDIVSTYFGRSKYTSSGVNFHIESHNDVSLTVDERSTVSIGQRVSLTGLYNREELNGKTGVVKSIDGDRAIVELSKDKVVTVSTTNLVTC